MFPSADQLLVFARSVEGDSLTTLHRKQSFKVAVVGANLEIIPRTGVGRKTDRAHISELLTRLSKTGSFQPEQYKDLTFNASYVLALVKLWQERHP